MTTHREGFTPPHGDVPLFDHSMTLPVEIGRAHSLGQLQSTAAAEYRAGVEAGRKQALEESAKLRVVRVNSDCSINGVFYPAGYKGSIP
jgi:hypothetical protein